MQAIKTAIGRRFRVEHFALVHHRDDRVKGLKNSIWQNAFAEQHGPQKFRFDPVLDSGQAFPRLLLLIGSPAGDIRRARVGAEPSHRLALDKTQHARHQRRALTKHLPVGRAPLESRDVQGRGVVPNV
jgi:hypothetical protein